MGETLSLFDENRASHSRDPATSYKAAAQAEGLAAKHHRKILRYLDGIFPMAAHYRDIAAGTGLEPVQVNRRLRELGPVDEGGAGLIERAGTVKMPQTNRDGTLWRIVPFAEAA